MDQFFDKYSKFPLSLRWLIICLIPIVIFASLYFLVYDPKVKELEKKKKNSAGLEKTYIENAAIRDNLPKFQEEVNILNQQLDRAVSLLPNETNVHTLFRQLFVEAEKANIGLLSYKPGSLNRRDFYSELNLDIKIVGTYHRIAEFIDRVGKLDRIINLNNINFSKAATPDRSDTVLEMNTVVTTYTFSGGASAVAPGQGTKGGKAPAQSRRRRR